MGFGAGGGLRFVFLWGVVLVKPVVLAFFVLSHIGKHFIS